MEPDIQRWLDFAENDLAVAKHLLETFHPKPLEIICYHCQQAAEKAIKAVYIALGIPGGIPKKHDLTFLLEQMKHRVDIPDAMFDHADDLNSYSIIVRYPNEIQIDERKVLLSVRYADEMTVWAKEAIRVHGMTEQGSAQPKRDEAVSLTNVPKTHKQEKPDV